MTTLVLKWLSTFKQSLFRCSHNNAKNLKCREIKDYFLNIRVRKKSVYINGIKSYAVIKKKQA